MKGKKTMAKYTSIGGQALIEGIMMKSPEKTAVAVRTPDKSIDITYLEQKSIKDKIKILKLPILRGIVGFIESLIQGYKALMLSADKSGFTDLEEEGKKKDPQKEKKLKSIFLGVAMTVGTVLGLALSVILFMYVPSIIADLFGKLVGIKDVNSPILPLVEQVLKLVVFVAYVFLVSLMKDIKRVFMYHGAEHKTIFCYEKGLELTVENVKKQSRFHPRCGTSFMILMIIISVIFSSLLVVIFPDIRNIKAVWVAAKILILPLIMGAGYEVLKICGRFDNLFTRIISAPGLWLQRITTKEPHDDMIEIAIAALEACEPEIPDVDRSIDKADSSPLALENEENNDDI